MNRDRTQKGRLIIISAPSGGGKTTIVERLLKGRSDLKRSISYTTRKPREGERDGSDYIFLTEEEFKAKKEKGEFLEWEEIFGEFYATGKKQVDEALFAGKDIILSIDVKGAKNVMRLYPESISIFILPPSEKVLKERLKERATDTDEEIRERLEEASREMAEKDKYDHIVANHILDEAVREVEKIVNKTKKGKK